MDAETQTGGKHKGRAGVSVVSALGFGRWALGAGNNDGDGRTAKIDGWRRHAGGRAESVGQNDAGGRQKRCVIAA